MYINGVKFACNTCVKGHRSSSCNHIERPLFEIRKKGRPVTQCTFCRDLRKTKQVHIKCTCSMDNKSKSIENIAMQMNHDGWYYSDIIKAMNYEDAPIVKSNYHTSPNMQFLDSSTRRRRRRSSNNSNSNKSSSSSSLNDEFFQPFNLNFPNNTDMCSDMIMNNQMIQQTDIMTNDVTLCEYPNISDPVDFLLLNQDMSPNPSIDMTRSTTTSSTNSTTITSQYAPQPLYYCPMVNNKTTQGESAIITITPLTQKKPTVSHIVTCYCGSNCACPGCFVHSQPDDHN